MSESHLRPWRVGVIGYGGYGRFLIETWRSLPELSVTALAGRNDVAVRALARDLNVPRVFSGTDAARALIDSPEIDIVVIASPPAHHAEAAVYALESGKHVFCEKPLATTVEDAERVARAVERSGCRLSMGFVLRFDPLFYALKRVVDDRIFGELHAIQFTNFAGDEALDPDHWFWDVTQSGGILVEHGGHFFDIYGWIVGADPVHVTGHRTHRAGTAQEDRVLASVEYANGVLATFYHAFDKPSRLERTVAHLAFDRGYVEIDGWIALRLAFDGALETGDRERLDTALPGWRSIDRQSYSESDREARGGGWKYRLTERVRGEWALPDPKQVVYEACAREAIRDLMRAIEEPGHHPRAGVETGLQAVRIAAAVPPPCR